MKTAKTKSKDVAVAALVSAFLPYIRKRAVRIESVGLAFDDIVQEGLIGLLNAVDSYDETKGTAFETFAIACIDNRIRSVLRQDARKKNQPLSNYISMSHESYDERIMEVSGSMSPEDFVVLREEVQLLLGRINENLSSFEKDVLALYLEGYSYLAISEILSSNPKSVDNALQRARRKLK